MDGTIVKGTTPSLIVDFSDIEDFTVDENGYLRFDGGE